MKQIKELFKNKKFVIGTVAVILLATVGTVFVLNQPQTKNEVAQQETISDEEHAKLLANIKKLQSADQKKTATVASTEVKEEKPTVEQPKKEEVKQKEENKKTQPVQPQPKKEVKVEQKPAPKVEQSKPIVKPEVPKSLPKPPVAPAKPKPKVEQPKKDRYIVSPIKLKGDAVFKTYEEARNYGNHILGSVGKDWEELSKKIGFKIGGWTAWSIEYSDGVVEWHLKWKE